MSPLLRRFGTPFLGPLLGLAAGLAFVVAAPSLLHAQGTVAAAPSTSVVAPTKTSSPKVKVKAAYVDVERCVGETEDGLRVKATLKKVSDRKQMYVTQVEERLKRQQEELAELAKGGDTQLLSKRVLEYQTDLQKYNDLIKRINNDLAIREDDLLAPIEKKVKAIFTRLAEEKGFDVIFDKKIMLVNTHPELDLTEQVIREYNWGTVTGGGTGGTAPVVSSGAPAGSAKPAASASATAPKPFIAPF